LEREFKAMMREETFTTVDDLAKSHVYGAAFAGGGAGGSSMKRHMKVTTEMASLPSLAVHWASSIAVRADETSIDLMRAVITGACWHKGRSCTAATAGSPLPLPPFPPLLCRPC